MDKLEKHLLAAIGKEKSKISPDNPYRELAFDGDNARLGWVESVSFSMIKKTLNDVSDILEGKDKFIFVGMGGSVNGIKPLIALFGDHSFYTLDSLDPKALALLLEELNDLDKTLVVAISKSGTTKETQSLAATLREVFLNKYGKDKWAKHFLWLNDPGSVVKVDSYGWESVKKINIQFDGGSDVGGRFSSPNTAIFILPLYLLLKRDIKALEKVYKTFTSLKADLHQRACMLCDKSMDKSNAYFSPVVEGKARSALIPWIVQLFQESLGSKIEGLAVKTIIGKKHDEAFFPIRMGIEVGEEAASLMCQMYFFQLFVTYYSGCHNINFVTQEYVEKYKNQMRKLESESKTQDSVQVGDIEDVISIVKERITESQKFIEIVLYFHPLSSLMERIEKIFEKKFPEKVVLAFVGSDWNHQSYQAAFGSRDTFFVLLGLESYCEEVEGVSKNTLLKNIETLQTIAKATYLTIKDKSLLFSLK